MEQLVNTKIFEKFMNENRLTKEEFCNICKTPIKVYEQIEIGDYDFDIVYLFRMAKVIGIEVCEIFQK